jgi:hypothetical protein
MPASIEAFLLDREIILRMSLRLDVRAPEFDCPAGIKIRTGKRALSLAAGLVWTAGVVSLESDP